MPTKRFKKLDPKFERAIEEQVKDLLHASRDCLRNQGQNTSKITFNYRNDYYAEAAGILRCLKILGYGYIALGGQPDKNIPKRNIVWWFDYLQKQVLKEENFGKSNECNFCVRAWGKDGAGRTRQSVGKEAEKKLEQLEKELG